MRAEETLARLYGYKGTDAGAFSKKVLNKADVGYARNMAKPKPKKTPVEQVLKYVALFAKQSLDSESLCIDHNGLSLWRDIPYGAAILMPRYKGLPPYFAINTVGIDKKRLRERALAYSPSLMADYGITVLPDFEPMRVAFSSLPNTERGNPVIRLCLVKDAKANPSGATND